MGGAAGQRTLNTYLKKQDKVQNDVNSEVENQNLNEDCSGEEIEEMLQTSFTEPSNIPIITNVWITKKYIHEFTECVQQESKNKGRFCQKEWLIKHDWLMYNREKLALFCDYCTRYPEQGKSSPFIFSDDSPGLKNWKKAVERIEEHRKCHSKAAMAMAVKKQTEISDLVYEEKNRSIQEERREGLAAHLDTVRVLLRQGLPLRGHTDEESNVYQFNKDKSRHVPGLRRLMNEKKYMSHEVLEEQEKDLVLSARNEPINEIRNAKFFSIICDESTDMSKTGQLTFSVRYCSYEYEVKDAFIGIIPCDNGLTSEALLGYIKDIMIRCSFDSQKLVAVAFDGASTMKHLAQLIKKEIAPHILYIHCVPHCNELVVKDASNNSALLEGAQSLCEYLYVLVGISPKRVLIFENLKKEMDGNGCVQRLKNLSRTRWTTRGNAINVILTKHEELKAALQAIKSDDNTKNDCKEKCNHFINKLDNFQQMFYMVSTFELIAILEHN